MDTSEIERRLGRPLNAREAVLLKNPEFTWKIQDGELIIVRGERSRSYLPGAQWPQRVDTQT